VDFIWSVVPIPGYVYRLAWNDGCWNIRRDDSTHCFHMWGWCEVGCHSSRLSINL